MTVQNNLSVGSIKRVGVNKRHSVAFRVTVILAVLLLWTYYCPILFPDYEDMNIVLYSLLFILPKLLVLFYLAHRIIKTSVLRKHYVYYAILLIVSIAVSFFATHSGIEKAIALCLFISIIIFYSYYRLRPSEIRSVVILCCLCVVAVMINSNTNFSVLPGRFNPNSTGFLFALLYCVFFTMAMGRKNPIYWILALVCFALQFVYVSRTALLGIALYTVLYLVFRARKKTFKYTTVFAAILILSVLGVIFAYLYSVTLFNIIGHGNVFILGKDLFTGRQVIWAGAFESIKQNLWFGVGSHLNEAMYEEGAYVLIMNAHNQPLGILSSFGIFVFVIYYLFLARAVSMQYKKTALNRAPALFLGVITVMSYFDIYFFAEYNYLFIGLVFAVISAVSVKSHTKGVVKCI